MGTRSRHARRAVGAGIAILVAACIPAAAQDAPAEDALVIGRRSTLLHSTYLGGSGISDSVTAATSDGAGNVYVTGGVDGTLPVTEGVVQEQPAGPSDAFVAKFAPSGELVWSTYLGGTYGDSGGAIAVGPDGAVYVVGTTLSEDLPVTPGAFQREFRGQNTGCEFVCAGDAFVARLSADASHLDYMTYLGGNGGETATGILVEDNGDALVTGFTSSEDYPASNDAFDPTYNKPTCFDQCEADAFVTRLNAQGSQVLASTYLGGSSWDSPTDVGRDADGNVYIAGSTRSVDLPTTEGAYQRMKNGREDFDFSGFVAGLDAGLTAARYVTYWGDEPEEHITALDVEPSGITWVTGFGGRGLPTTTDALQPTYGGGASDVFVTAFDPDGSGLAYSTRFGGAREDYGRGIALHPDGSVSVAGSTASTDLPMRRAFQPASGGFDDLFFTTFRIGADRPGVSTYIGGENFEAATDLVLTETGIAYVTGSSESARFPLAGHTVQNDTARSDGVLVALARGRSTHVKVDDVGFWQPRVRMNLGRSLRWHFAATASRKIRLRETSVGLLDSRRRPPGSTYLFTFPAGRYTIAHPSGDVVQRVAVAPVARYADDGSGVEVRWARFPLPSEFSFDVQVKTGDGPWEAWVQGTRDIGAVLEGGAADYRFRVRARNDDAGMTGPWSPAGLLSSPS